MDIIDIEWIRQGAVVVSVFLTARIVLHSHIIITITNVYKSLYILCEGAKYNPRWATSVPRDIAAVHYAQESHGPKAKFRMDRTGSSNYFLILMVTSAVSL